MTNLPGESSGEGKKVETGKVGIWSKVSKQFVFGIAEDNAKDAYRELAKRIPYWDTQKYRWVCKPLPKYGYIIIDDTPTMGKK